MVTCPSCGHENAAGARFCNACGAELATASAHEVRKTVTVLFADVTGSTALGERLDPEAFRRVMARYFETARGCLERHGGTVEKFIGDAVMAVFGVPTAHEDDALRALRAAADLRDSLASLNDELERDYGVSLALRVGVNTGAAVTGTEERLATGDAVNVAARLEQAAQPGEILIGEQTRALALGAIEVDAVAPLSVKGKAAPVTAHRLLRVVEGAPAFERRLDAPLVGRREELAWIRSAFGKAVSDRRCGLVTVIGPPGIGKSRLAREVAGALTDEATVLSGRCLPYGEGITYWPLVEIFREGGAEHELDAALAAGAPEEIFWSVRKALERQARKRPLALIVEDIHWAEPTLLDLIEHLSDWTRDAPLFLLSLARPELVDKRPAWRGQSLTLEPLSRQESERLIGELLGSTDVDSEIQVRVRDVAEGNPLFVEQLVAMLAEGGDLDRVPATMQALLAARLDALADDERDLLERASVIGLEFEWEALGELATRRRRPSGALLAALVRKELIRPHEAIEDTFRFRHILIRDAAYERIPKALRSELHERFAGWLDGRGEEFEEIVGYHLEQAFRFVGDLGPVDDRARALGKRAGSHLAASGLRASARGDMPAAANLFDRAVALFPPDDRRALSLLPSLARSEIDAGRWERANALLARAVARAGAMGEPGVAADAAVALAYLRLHGQSQTGHEETTRELEAAIEVFEKLGDQAGLARARNLAGWMRLWRGDCAAAMGDLERAARHAHEAGDRAEEADCLRGVLTSAVFGPMPVESALERIEDVRRRMKGNRKIEVSVLGMRGWLEAMQGRFDVARPLVAEAKDLAEEFGLEALIAGSVLRMTGEVELLAGDFDAAEHALRTACEMLERIGNVGHFASMAPVFADAVYALGRGEEAAHRMEVASNYQLKDDLDAQVGWRRARARLLAQRGGLERAEELAGEAVELATRTDFLDARARALVDLGEVLRLAEKPKESASALETAIRVYEQKGNVVSAERLRNLLAERPLEV